MADVELGVVREGISGALQELAIHQLHQKSQPLCLWIYWKFPGTGVDPGFSEGGANSNAWPHDHGKGEGARERMELLPCVLNICS